jgi:hypothetical protein
MRLLYPSLLLLSACDASPPAGSSAGGADDRSSAEANAAGTNEQVPSPLQARAESALAASFRPGEQLILRNLRLGSGGAICGEVATQALLGLAGAFRPFIVAAAGDALVSQTSVIDFGDTQSTFPDRWIEACASPEELRRLENVVDSGPFLPPDLNLIERPVEREPSDLPPLMSESEPDTSGPLETVPELGNVQQPTIDSFANSVRRR